MKGDGPMCCRGKEQKKIKESDWRQKKKKKKKKDESCGIN
jgi:hypothetical protein